jgi:hypothetical protein
MEIEDAVKGGFYGCLLGASVGLGVCVWIFDEPPFFMGDTILIGGILGAIAGYIWGEDFIDLIKNWWWWP